MQILTYFFKRVYLKKDVFEIWSKYFDKCIYWRIQLLCCSDNLIFSFVLGGTLKFHKRKFIIVLQQWFNHVNFWEPWSLTKTDKLLCRNNDFNTLYLRNL